MGYLLHAICKCGFEKQFDFGGFRANFDTVSMVPAIEKLTNTFVNINFLEEKDTKKFNFYTVQTHKGYELSSGNKKSFKWNDLELNATNNYCPKCKNYSLDFNLEMLID